MGSFENEGILKVLTANSAAHKLLSSLHKRAFIFQKSKDRQVVSIGLLTTGVACYDHCTAFSTLK